MHRETSEVKDQVFKKQDSYIPDQKGDGEMDPDISNAFLHPIKSNIRAESLALREAKDAVDSSSGASDNPTIEEEDVPETRDIHQREPSTSKPQNRKRLQAVVKDNFRREKRKK